jgi:hypothetical protein
MSLAYDIASISHLKDNVFIQTETEHQGSPT